MTRSMFLLVALVVAGCAAYPDRDPTLDEMKAAVAADDAARIGGWLMNRPLGIRVIDGRDTGTPTVAVHGYASEGREWVAPLVTLDAPGTRFYRWDWITCPEDGVERLAAAIDALAARPGIEGIRVVGHSYGGLITALFAHRYRGEVPIEAHVVAAPLTGIPRMEALCGALKPGAAGDGRRTITQWRTVKAQDGAFRKLDRDPQIVDWAGADVIELPAEWKGGRLGHNRALKWVAERMKAAPAN